MLKSFLAALLLTASSTGVRAFAPCSEGFSEISVENVNGIFCVKGSTICASNISQGACPAVQEGLAYGSYCGVVASGVYGCKALDSESVKTFQPWVEPGSTPAPTTVATPAPTTGETPTPTTAETPAPSSAETPAPTTAETPSPTTAETPAPAIGQTPASTSAETPALTTAETPAPTTAETPAPTTADTPASSTATSSTVIACDNGGSPVSVEGVDGVFCTIGNAVCSGEVSTGVCPAAQSGLPLGSYCGRVASGVYGCKVLTDNVSTPSPTSAGTPSPTTSSSSSTPSVSPTPTPATTPAPTTTTPAPATTATPTTTPATTTTILSVDCPNGGNPMSIEGVEKIFCVTGVACAANTVTGNCPGKQGGLPFGSFCDVVRTGVYGCRPYIGENEKPDFTIAPPRSCAGNPAGNTPVSIVGATRDFCAQEPICAGHRYGNCPGIQEGLAQESICSLISYSVHGCIFKP